MGVSTRLLHTLNKSFDLGALYIIMMAVSVRTCPPLESDPWLSQLVLVTHVPYLIRKRGYLQWNTLDFLINMYVSFCQMWYPNMHMLILMRHYIITCPIHKAHSSSPDLSHQRTTGHSHRHRHRSLLRYSATDGHIVFQGHASVHQDLILRGDAFNLHVKRTGIA